MTTDIVMPNMGFDTQEGKLVEWLKQPGDPVAKGEPIAIIESDKANVELESVAGGLLLERLVVEGWVKKAKEKRPFSHPPPRWQPPVAPARELKHLQSPNA
jgi:pyruvate/2-oxoglutarate dehydrogenase complex dihydrolipoamide acyltransferase (E2) component